MKLWVHRYQHKYFFFFMTYQYNVTLHGIVVLYLLFFQQILSCLELLLLANWYRLGYELSVVN